MHKSNIAILRNRPQLFESKRQQLSKVHWQGECWNAIHAARKWAGVNICGHTSKQTQKAVNYEAHKFYANQKGLISNC